MTTDRLTVTGRSGLPVSYTHNEVNEYIAISSQIIEPQHDDNGNLIRNDRGFLFEYDYENRLTGVREPGGDLLALYTYDALGRRNSEIRTDETVPYAFTIFIFDGKNVVVEYNHANEALIRYYVHGGQYIDERAVVHEASNGKDYAYANNRKKQQRGRSARRRLPPGHKNRANGFLPEDVPERIPAQAKKDSGQKMCRKGFRHKQQGFRHKQQE